MNKKIIGILICGLLIALLIPTTTLSSIETKSTNPSNNQPVDDIYAKQLLEIEQAIEENNANWIAGYTIVFGPYAEFEPRCGVIEEVSDNEYTPIEFTGPLPSEWDWRNVDGKNWMTSVKSQGGCGSCVAFGTLGALEAVVQIEKGAIFDCDLSEAFLFYCGGGTCDGGWFFKDAAAFVTQTGVPDELCFPYKAVDTPCEQHAENSNSRVVKASSSTVSDIKTALVKYGPLLTHMKVYEDFRAYRSGIYEHVSGNEEGGHGVTIVGYKDDKSIDAGGYWICKNSWGTDWGEKGYFRIKYRECEIGDPTYYFDKVTGNIPPFAPTFPHPNDLEQNIDRTVNLSWSASQDLDNEKVYYTVYLSEGRSVFDTDIIASKIAKSFITVKNLKYDTAYSWKVLAEDERGSQSGGEKWMFGTRTPNKPLINGTNEGKKKTDYTYTASLPDADSDGHYYYWFFDWGDDTNTGWIGPYGSDDQVTAKHSWTKQDEYTIMVRYQVDEVSSEWATLPVTMSYSYYKPISPFLQLLFQLFPTAFPLFRQLMG